MTQGFFQFNNSIINEIKNFATSSFDLFFLSGPKGSSKSETIEKVIPEFDGSNLIFRHFCFENTVIDDFLLNFYDKLRDFSLARQISLKKFNTGDFKEKVSHYFKTIFANCIIIVENFEKVENNTEIVDFLSHLASYSNVKIIIVTRNQDKNLFLFKDVEMLTYHIEQISKEDFKSKLVVLTNPLDEDIKEKFYKITGGLELYLNMTIKYSINTGFTIPDLISEFERKNVDFERFIVSKFISLTPLNYRDFYKTLCALSHPISIDFVKEYNLGNVSYLEYLVKNFLLSRFNNEFYVKDYFKKYMLETFSIQEKVGSYKKLADAYENELTKSPKDRLLRLSRESIRKEIERLSSLVPKVQSKPKNISYIGISGIIHSNEREQRKYDLTEKLKKIKDRKNKLTSEETALLASRRLEETSQKSLVDENKQENRKFIISLINSAREMYNNYNYKDAISELNRAFDMDWEDEFKIEICSMRAKCASRLSEYSDAEKDYKTALELAKKKGDSRRCVIECAIAQLNKNMYRTNEAKEQFKLIAINDDNPDKYRAVASIELGEIEEAAANLDDAIRHYENALSFSLGKDKELTCKSYYRLAVLYDENSNTQEAVKYYKKNYTTSSEHSENKYYSISLTNLALIYIEQSKYREASEYLRMALIFDTENNDLENMYFSQKELAKLYINLDKENTIMYYKQALNSAQKLEDNFKIALVYFEAGEFYYDEGEDEKALSNFLSAKNTLLATLKKPNPYQDKDLYSPQDAPFDMPTPSNSPKDENIARINLRIQDIKMRLDSATFNLIMEKYEKNNL